MAARMLPALAGCLDSDEARPLSADDLPPAADDELPPAADDALPLPPPADGGEALVAEA